MYVTNGKSRAKDKAEKFSWNKSAEKIEEIYRSL